MGIYERGTYHLISIKSGHRVIIVANPGFGLFFRHGDDLIVTPFAQVSVVWWMGRFVADLKI